MKEDISLLKLELLIRQWRIHAKQSCDLTWVYKIQTLTLNWFLKTPTEARGNYFKEQESGKGMEKGDELTGHFFHYISHCSKPGIQHRAG